jgi:hypothetical protein
MIVLETIRGEENESEFVLNDNATDGGTLFAKRTDSTTFTQLLYKAD